MIRPSALLLSLLLSSTPAFAQHVHEEPASPEVLPAGQAQAPSDPLPPFIPAVTEAMRQAAFPDVGEHDVHGVSTRAFVMADHLEFRAGDAPGLTTDVTGWIGRDLNRLWFRSEAAADADGLTEARLEAFYGRAYARWWDVVVGLRQDARPGPARSWAAIGLQGLAPYWFEVEATAYIGGSGRTELRLDAEYDLLVTNRLVLQPLVTIDMAGKADPERRLGAGVTHMEGALRLRYEVWREFAPYVGLTWERAFGDTARMRREDGGSAADRRVVVGVRLWY